MIRSFGRRPASGPHDAVELGGMAKTTRWQRFRADLTGESDRWGRTILYGVLFARLALAPVLLVIGLFFMLSTGASDPSNSLAGTSALISEVDAFAIVSGVIVAPLFESLILVFLVWLMSSKLGWRAWITALVCALLFVPLHGFAAGSFIIAPFFWLMALVQYNWMRRGDGLGGYWIVATMHAVSNASSLLTTAIFRGGGA